MDGSYLVFIFQYTIENFCSNSIYKNLLHIFISNLSQIIEHNTQQLLDQAKIVLDYN